MNKAVQNKEALILLLRNNREQLYAYGVESIGLFGSFVRSKDIKKDSDVDFLIDFKTGQKTFQNFMQLSYFLEELLGRKVDIVTRQSLSPYIGPYILQAIENVAI